jgi:hypothetical protein
MNGFVRVAVIAFMTLAAHEALACSSDVDCKGDRVCKNGQCVDPSPSQRPAPRAPQGEPQRVPAEAAAAPSSGPAADKTTSVYVNSLGLLQFGLAPTIEFGSKLAVNARVHLFNTGVLPYVLAGEDTLNFSWGLGAGLRGYSGQGGNLRGGYWGVQALYVSWSETWKEKILYETKAVALLAEGGYRWVYPSGFTLGVGIVAGPAPILDASTKAVNGYTLYPGDKNDASTMFIGFLTVDLGFML